MTFFILHLINYKSLSSTQKIDIAELQKFESLELLAKQIVEGFIVGLHKSPFHGFSVEFSEHRHYNKGESSKHIDWKIYGRTDKLYVKKYEEETNLRCQIIIDSSSSMYFPEPNYNKIKFSIYAAAAIITLLKKQRDASGLSVFAKELETYIPPKSSKVHIQHLFSELEKLLVRGTTIKTTAAADAIHKMAEIIHKRSLVVIFSDMLDNEDSHDKLFSALQHLKYNKHEVLLFHTIDKAKEQNFEFDNIPYRFVDMESGAELKAYPDEVRKAYLEQYQAFSKSLQLKCAQYGIEYVQADIQQGFKEVLQAFLIKRAKVK